jgi:hypothetical protein
LWEEEMLEYATYALLGLIVIGVLVYATMSPEVEHPPRPRPDAEQ